jgi:ankyrin repeat protein
MDVATYLLDNGADVDEAVTPEQHTPLHVAAYLGEIDILRMLLDRGASLDRFDEHGADASTDCIAPSSDRKVASVDLLKVISGHISIDTNAFDSLRGVTLLHWIAWYQSASEIDFLISLNFNVEVRDSDGYNALCYAAIMGNPATYFALLSHGSETAHLEDHLLRVIEGKADSFDRPTQDITFGPGLYDPILRDILNRRVDLMTSNCIVDGEVEEIQGPAIPLQQAVAALGPETEAWFLGLLQECGRETEEDQRRLQELRMGGYGQHGTVIGEVDEESDYDSGDEDPECAGSESDRSSARSEADDAEEDERFWDAEEGA